MPSLISAAPPAAAASRIDRFADVQALTAADMAAVDTLIHTRLASDVVLINQVAAHIVGSGGKRLRPMLHLIAARAAAYVGRDHVQLAALIEFIHTSTLLHDDVVDESDLRRGRKTANAVWGNAASVLVGDFLYSRSFQMMVELDSMRVMRILADTPLARIDDIEFVRTVAVARITMASSMVRLSAGRESMSDATQALCFLAGANSIFTGDKLLTAGNAGGDADAALLGKLGMLPMTAEEPMRIAAAGKGKISSR